LARDTPFLGSRKAFRFENRHESLVAIRWAIVLARYKVSRHADRQSLLNPDGLTSDPISNLRAVCDVRATQVIDVDVFAEPSFSYVNRHMSSGLSRDVVPPDYVRGSQGLRTIPPLPMINTLSCDPVPAGSCIPGSSRNRTNSNLISTNLGHQHVGKTDTFASRF
jgi:hypothetical protein